MSFLSNCCSLDNIQLLVGFPSCHCWLQPTLFPLIKVAHYIGWAGAGNVKYVFSNLTNSFPAVLSPTWKVEQDFIESHSLSAYKKWRRSLSMISTIARSWDYWIDGSRGQDRQRGCQQWGTGFKIPKTEKISVGRSHLQSLDLSDLFVIHSGAGWNMQTRAKSPPTKALYHFLWNIQKCHSIRYIQCISHSVLYSIFSVFILESGVSVYISCYILVFLCDILCYILVFLFIFYHVIFYISVYILLGYILFKFCVRNTRICLYSTTTFSPSTAPLTLALAASI